MEKAKTNYERRLQYSAAQTEWNEKNSKPEGKRLMVRSALNYELYKKMEREDVRKTLAITINTACQKALNKEDYGDYDVRAEYVLIDSMYNKHGLVKVSATFSVTNGVRIKNCTYNEN